MTITTSGRIPVSEAARIAHVNVTTVSRWIRSGKIRADKVGTGLRSPYLVDRSDVERVARERAGEFASQVLAIQAAS